MEVKIEFKSKSRIFNLILAFIWIALGSARMIIDDDFNWVSYAYIALGALYFVVFYLQSKRNYLLIKEGFLIKKYDFWSKSIALSDIISVRKFAGDYKLKTKSDELIINTQLLEDESLSRLNTLLEELDIVWE